MSVVLRGRRTWLLWALTCLSVLAISLSALTVAFGSPLPQSIRAGLSAVRAAEVEQVVRSYRDGEAAALLTLDAAVLAQLPVFATGEALDDVTSRVDALWASGSYQQLEIGSLTVVQVVEEDPYRYVMTEEVHAVTALPQAPGSAAGERKTAAWQVVYTLVQEAGRWKVSKVAAAER